MRIGDATIETGVRWKTPADERPAVQLPHKVEVDPPQKLAEPIRPIEVPKIESVTKQIDSFLRNMGRSINFRVDPGSGRTIVSVVNATTGEVIREVPGEEALKLALRIEASLSALLDETA